MHVWVRLGTNFSLPVKRLSSWNTDIEMVVRRSLCGATNETWVRGESTFQTAAQTFALEIETMIVPRLTGTLLSNSKHLPKQTRHRCEGSWKSLFLIKYRWKCKCARWEFSKSLPFTGWVTELSCRSNGASYLQKLKHHNHFIEDGLVLQIYSSFIRQRVTNKIVLPFLPDHKNKKLLLETSITYILKSTWNYLMKRIIEVIRSRIRQNYISGFMKLIYNICEILINYYCKKWKLVFRA